MNLLSELIPEFEDYLKSVKASMIYDLEFFIERESLNPKLQMLSFIYSFEDFKTVVYSVDDKGGTITDVIGLPIKNYENLYSMENYERFVPYELEEKKDVIYQEYQAFDDENKLSEYWDYSIEYQSKKNDIFKNWFIDCWQIASMNTNTRISACLAIEDSSGGIDLTTGKHISDDEIEKFFDN